MWPSLNGSIPLLCVDNIYDYYKDFLSRYENPQEGNDFYQNLCTRLMFYGGLPKLVVCQKAVVLYDYLREHLGLEGYTFVIPDEIAGESTVEKIIQCPAALERILTFSGVQKQLQIISFACTSDMWDLAQYLEEKFDITIVLPELPSKENLWIPDYLKTKRGFRSIASTTFSPEEKALPEGFICQDEQEMISVIKWFLAQNRHCIVKPERGIEGRGILIFDANYPYKEDEIRAIFEEQKYLFAEEPIIVEQRIHHGSNKILSPSVEYYIPPKGQGEPVFTYLVNQVFHEDVRFVGNIISKIQYSAPWCPSLLEKGERLAKKVQELGYVGYMDIDCIVDENHNVYFVEINPRRTGGTHIHEIAVQLFGENYIEEVTLISNANLKVRGIQSFEELYAASIDLLYAPHQKKQGIIITEANLLSSYGKISVLSMGKDEQEATDYLVQFQDRISQKYALKSHK
ncbi:MAG: ATP-grasp domain-containing protein [Prochloraceae cyanobacterium]|nr:ATP-grasp domain-containing protein [Prochloraceae cyanobacterium]